ncbi:MAG: LOG family protein [Gemmatimonadota bacterium]|nr:LOG family protein [Gemmatimonadota bacterium]
MSKMKKSYRKCYVPQDFLLSPEAAPVRAVAESIYPFYLRAAYKRGDKVEPQPVPVCDDRFMNSHQARWVRIVAEITHAQIMMKKHKVHHTVVFFGSAQIPEPEVTRERLEDARSSGDEQAEKQALKEMEISDYYDQARELAARLTRWSMDAGTPENPQPFVVCTGGGPSMMEAVNRGAHEVGGKSVGLNITLPTEQEPNPYISPELNFHFHYFFTRKYHFLYRAKVMVVLPGGYGSLDELFEGLNLIRCGKIVKNMAIVLYGSRFWKKVINFDTLVEWGVIYEEDKRMFTYADTVESAFNTITDHLSRFIKK